MLPALVLVRRTPEVDVSRLEIFGLVIRRQDEAMVDIPCAEAMLDLRI
ncbi:hypothetical protein H9L15_10400 [Sphingomonas daechungensis]|uniref:Uncharacterized protein n=1 Tax=Sphingomonas daechungensis TaxID=1176646 RepID=A0ABX6T6I9_9SPHN|nr:hypothetical protein H9L15_10400 [Sphingomonas daechungensis]